MWELFEVQRDILPNDDRAWKNTKFDDIIDLPVVCRFSLKHNLFILDILNLTKAIWRKKSGMWVKLFVALKLEKSSLTEKIFKSIFSEFEKKGNEENLSKYGIL